MQKVVLLGAGASRGTLGCRAPTADEFGQYVASNITDWTTEYPALSAVVRFLERRIPDTSEKSWALDKVWGAIDNGRKLRYILHADLVFECDDCGRPIQSKTPAENDIDFGDAGFQLRKLLSRVYGDDLRSEIDAVAERQGTLKQELTGLGEGDCVLSFNYDLLVERTLSKLGYRPFTPDPDTANPSASNAIAVINPHGSLSWKTRLPEAGSKVEFLPDSLPEDQHVPSSPTVQAGIISPVPFKEQIAIPEIQCTVPHFFRLLVHQWQSLIQVLASAQQVAVMGYRFPAEDLHALYLFGEAAGIRGDKNLNVSVYQRNHESHANLCKTMSKIFRNACFKYVGPVTTYS